MGVPSLTNGRRPGGNDMARQMATPHSLDRCFGGDRGLQCHDVDAADNLNDDSIARGDERLPVDVIHIGSPVTTGSYQRATGRCPS